MEAAPDWLYQVEPDGGEEIPEWSAAPAGTAEEPTIAEMDEDIPDWLTGLGDERDEKVPAPALSAELPVDWLAGIRDQFTEEAPEDIFTAFAAEETPAPEWLRDEEWPPAEEPDSTVPAPSEIPDWMQELAPPEPAAATPTAPAAEETPIPDWMASESVPSGDDALAWLEQLTVGKEDELQTQALAESEARMAEIMGRPTPAEAPPEPTAAPPVEQAAPAAAEIPDWMQELAPSIEAPVTPVEPAPTPDISEDEEIAPDDEAFAWLGQQNHRSRQPPLPRPRCPIGCKNPRRPA
jgi:hypothetical protein